MMAGQVWFWSISIPPAVSAQDGVHWWCFTSPGWSESLGCLATWNQATWRHWNQPVWERESLEKKVLDLAKNPCLLLVSFVFHLVNWCCSTVTRGFSKFMLSLLKIEIFTPTVARPRNCFMFCSIIFHKNWWLQLGCSFPPRLEVLFEEMINRLALSTAGTDLVGTKSMDLFHELRELALWGVGRYEKVALTNATNSAARFC